MTRKKFVVHLCKRAMQHRGHLNLKFLLGPRVIINDFPMHIKNLPCKKNWFTLKCTELGFHRKFSIFFFGGLGIFLNRGDQNTYTYSSICVFYLNPVGRKPKFIRNLIKIARCATFRVQMQSPDSATCILVFSI